MGSPFQALELRAKLYRLGPRAAGFDKDRWTQDRFAEAIFKNLKLRYDADHVGRLMHRFLPTDPVSR